MDGVNQEKGIKGWEEIMKFDADCCSPYKPTGPDHNISQALYIYPLNRQSAI
jgi:hypothetical protein